MLGKYGFHFFYCCFVKFPFFITKDRVYGFHIFVGSEVVGKANVKSRYPVDPVPVFEKIRLFFESGSDQACLYGLDTGIFCRIFGFYQVAFQEHAHPAVPHKSFKIILQFFRSGIMASCNILGIVFIVQENGRGGKTFVCFYQNELAFNILFHK
ncbi:hypothetical protein SDC9_121996 [bioreactor metagenome]|uniref:Uncharacterized protein n=1 Tax=bioreactor metagenome TaxID=1076179 RepID=A0A645CDM6_9ZZZZ